MNEGEEGDGLKDEGEDAESWDAGKKQDLTERSSQVVLHPAAV